MLGEGKEGGGEVYGVHALEGGEERVFGGVVYFAHFDAHVFEPARGRRRVAAEYYAAQLGGILGEGCEDGAAEAAGCAACKGDGDHSG